MKTFATLFLICVCPTLFCQSLPPQPPVFSEPMEEEFGLPPLSFRSEEWLLDSTVCVAENLFGEELRTTVNAPTYDELGRRIESKYFSLFGLDTISGAMSQRTYLPDGESYSLLGWNWENGKFVQDSKSEYFIHQDQTRKTRHYHWNNILEQWHVKSDFCISYDELGRRGTITVLKEEGLFGPMIGDNRWRYFYNYDVGGVVTLFDEWDEEKNNWKQVWKTNNLACQGENYSCQIEQIWVNDSVGFQNTRQHRSFVLDSAGVRLIQETWGWDLNSEQWYPTFRNLSGAMGDTTFIEFQKYESQIWVPQSKSITVRLTNGSRKFSYSWNPIDKDWNRRLRNTEIVDEVTNTSSSIQEAWDETTSTWVIETERHLYWDEQGNFDFTTNYRNTEFVQQYDECQYFYSKKILEEQAESKIEELNCTIPNPFHGCDNIWCELPAEEVAEEYDIELFDMSGRLVAQMPLSENTIFGFGHRPLANGMYVLRIKAEGKSTLTKKILIFP